MQHSVRLVTTPDIRSGSFISFLYLLQAQYPIPFGIISPTDRKTGGMWLQETLRIPPSGCVEIYKKLSRHYHIPACQFTCYQLAWRDQTLRRLHQQLWHEANQFEKTFRPYELR